MRTLHRPSWSLLTAALVAALFAGCSKKDDAAAAAAEAGKPSAYRISAADEALIKQKFPEAKETATGLRMIVRKPGNGPKPKYGARVTMNYDLRLLDGTPIESSLQSGGPLTVPIGVGRVIKAWDEAVMEMSKGEKRTLIVPHYLGYGVTGNPPKIPPYATLVFEVELLDIP